MAQADLVESCNYEIKIDETETSLVEISVEDGKNGGIEIGLVHINKELKIISDAIVVKNFYGENKNEVFRESMLSTIAASLEIDLSKMESSKLVTIDPEAQADDASGASVITVYDKDQNIITKVAQAGWSFGICK